MRLKTGGRQKENMGGLKFGRLSVLSFIEGKLWKALCDCGNVVTINRDRLRTKGIRSCGCFNKERIADYGKVQSVKNRKALGYASSKKTYSNRKRSAKSRRIYFDITFEQFLQISSRNYYYCDIEPKQCCKYENTYGDYYYNGMDRVDSKKGYLINNVVACCWNCNKAKASLSQEDFLRLIENIYNNRIKNEK